MLVERHSKDTGFAELLKECRDVKHGRKPAPVTKEDVITEQTVRMKVQRTYACATEKDMKKASGLSRIPRAAVKHLPSVTLPTENGGDEVMYIFKDDEPQKKLMVEVEVGTVRQKFDMPSFTHSGQSINVAQHTVSQFLEATGASRMLDSGGVCHWSEFLEQKLLKKEPEQDACTPSVEVVDDDDEGALEGAAASSMAAAAAEQTSGVGKAKASASSTKPGLHRIQSSQSLSGSVFGDEPGAASGKASTQGDQASAATGNGADGSSKKSKSKTPLASLLARVSLVCSMAGLCSLKSCLACLFRVLALCGIQRICQTFSGTWVECEHFRHRLALARGKMGARGLSKFKQSCDDLCVFWGKVGPEASPQEGPPPWLSHCPQVKIRWKSGKRKSVLRPVWMAALIIAASTV